LQSTCSFVTQFYLRSTRLQFTINLLFTKLLQLEFKLPATCNPLLFDHNFNYHTNCLQLAIRCSLPTTSTGIPTTCNLQSVAICIQLLLAFKLPATCIPLHFAYNFNWHSNCLQFTINLLSVKNIKWHSNCLQLAIRGSCLQLQLAYQLPATCNPFAVYLQLLLVWNARNLQSVCSLPTTTTSIQIACKFAICLLFAYNYHSATWFLDLHLLRAQCLRKVNSDISQIICEPSHATNCILSAKHALILLVSLYSDPVQVFENVVLTIYSETHLIT